MGCSFQDGTRPGCFSQELRLVGEWTSGSLFPSVLGCPISKPHHVLSDLQEGPVQGSRGLGYLGAGEGCTEGQGWAWAVSSGPGREHNCCRWLAKVPPSTAIHSQASPWGSHARSVLGGGGRSQACKEWGDSRQPLSF